MITEAARKEKINQNAKGKAKGKAKGRKNKNNASMDKQTVGDMLNLQAGKESVEEQESAPTITGNAYLYLSISIHICKLSMPM